MLTGYGHEGVIQVSFGRERSMTFSSLFSCAYWVLRFCIIVRVVGSVLITSAFGLVGQIDSNNQFPYVLLLQSDTGQCSAVVSRAGLVSTAAHCVWEADGGFSRNLRMTYTDADGQEKIARARKIFIPEEYKLLNARYDAALKNGKREQSDDGLMAKGYYDIAFIVPDRFIEVEGFPHWATELKLVPQNISALELEHELGPLSQVTTLDVGFGNYLCKDFNQREAGCVNDTNRRFAQSPLKSSLDFRGKTYSPPRYWCIGVGTNVTSVVQHGDSGGPTFVKALDGRWLFVGYHSAGASNWSCSSSLLAHLDLWRVAAAYWDSYKESLPYNGADNWWSSQTRRVWNEILESWSSPNSEALRRLSTFYTDISADCKSQSQFSSIVDAKTAFAVKWPVRSFRIKSDTFQYEEDDIGEPGNYAGAKATILWDVSNPATGAHETGSSQMRIGFKFGRELELALVDGENAPHVVTEKVLAATGNTAALECEPAKRLSSGTLWHHNGSSFVLKASGIDRAFYYEEPLVEMTHRGVQKGTLLFKGRRIGDTYSGIAFVFTKCGPKSYTVTGTVEPGDRTINMAGRAPRFDANCHQAGDREDNLTFSLDEDY